MAGHQRPGAVRKTARKGPSVGTGGHNRRSLEGRGPTPKAEDRTYHKAHKAKQLSERSAAKRGPARGGRSQRPTNETVTGRNSVLEALRAGIPAKALYVATRIEMDDRVKEALKLATEAGIALMDASKPELDRMTEDAVHQGLALVVPPYDYADGIETIDELADKWQKGYIPAAPIVVALDGITDPRNLGAIIRSVSAFAGHSVIVPERRSVGMTASAWKTSAGAAVRVPVARASNLNSTLKHAQKRGFFVLGLDGDGDVSLPGLSLASEPIVIVVGSEGKGLSRLVRENCDQIVSIPIDSAMESLNASMAVGITLYEVSRQRSGAGV